MPKTHQTSLTLVVAGGMISLVIAMGIGRFAYTPLLPIMQQRFSFGEDVGGVIASANYLGYLLGAIACWHHFIVGNRTFYFRLSLIVCVGSTGSMGLTSTISIWLALRWVTGFSSAVIFVLGSMIVLETLAVKDRMHLSGALYSGVGVGIALSGWVVPALNDIFGAQGTWLGLAVLSLLLATVCWPGVVDPKISVPKEPASFSRCSNIQTTLLRWLTAAYFCEGLGYIVSGTFLVAMVQRLSGTSLSGNQAWIIVGLSAAGSTFLWSVMARRTGFLPALVGAYILQSAGIVLPVFYPNPLGIYMGAALFGGTFMGITALSLSMGRMIDSRPNSPIIGTLTVVYSVGQIIGPTLAGVLVIRLGGFNFPLMMAAAVVALGAVLVSAGGIFNKMDLFSNSKPKGEEHAVCKY